MGGKIITPLNFVMQSIYFPILGAGNVNLAFYVGWEGEIYNGGCFRFDQQILTF
jgi:hypothetical protein